MNALFMSYLEKVIKVFVSSVSWSNLLIISYIITSILEWRVVAGIDPQNIASKALDIIELLDDSVYITDSISISIIE